MNPVAVESPSWLVDLPVTTLGMALIFGPLVLAWLMVEVSGKMTNRAPLSESTMTLLRCGSVIAAVLCLCYVCENHAPFPHLTKTPNPLMYWGTFAVLIVASLFSLRKSHMSDFMHRDQTEEWKGWMQFLFLAYHYWKMEANYNDIRVYITCYLWMTGFGNFSFFYLKQDFTLIRAIQMVWRMNFFVLLLCLTMNNPYIVYYICPLHTFFFFVTYATMALWSNVNRSQYGAAVKVFVAAVLLYLVFDIIPRSFHVIFGWLGTQSSGASIGAHGTEWEWYFRSFLDHFSTVWGMVFALNMPFLSEWYKQIESFSAYREWSIKLSVLGVLGALFAVWVKQVYMQDKTGYNSIHSYYGVIPLMAYLFLRNISVTLRSYYLHTLHLFGTITLESYLLQYHIWLADNAGMLLNIIPGYPVLNYVVASSLHVFCAFQIFHATTKLRSILVPSDVGVALRNLAIMSAAVAAACCAAILILRYSMHVGALFGIVGATAAMATQALFQWHRHDEAQTRLASTNKVGTDKATDALNSKPMLWLFGFVIVLGGSFLLHAQDFAPKSGSAVGIQANAAIQEHSLLQLTDSASAYSGLEDFADSFTVGRITGFVIGSLAQPWHGLVAIFAILLCLATNDPLFGLSRLSQAIFGPSGQKSISWEAAYGPLLEKLGERKRDSDAESAETQPLITGDTRAAASY
jgi:hypothetical protein